jgi:hypothetical protein
MFFLNEKENFKKATIALNDENIQMTMTTANDSPILIQNGSGGQVVLDRRMKIRIDEVGGSFGCIWICRVIVFDTFRTHCSGCVIKIVSQTTVLMCACWPNIFNELTRAFT